MEGWGLSPVAEWWFTTVEDVESNETFKSNIQQMQDSLDRHMNLSKSIQNPI